MNTIHTFPSYFCRNWAVTAGPSSKAVPMRKFSAWTLQPVITFPSIIVRGLAAVSEWKGWGRNEQFTWRAVWSPDLHVFLFASPLHQGSGQEHRCDGLPSRGRLVCRIDRVGDGTDVLVWRVSCKFGFWFVFIKWRVLVISLLTLGVGLAGQDQGWRWLCFHCKFF